MALWTQLAAYATRRRTIIAVIWFWLVVILVHVWQTNTYAGLRQPPPSQEPQHPKVPQPPLDDGRFHWEKRRVRFPVISPRPLPSGLPLPIPKIQAHPSKEDAAARNLRLERLAAVKEAFQHAWTGYKTHAWMADEVGPLSGSRYDTFGGWAASLVDALDTLWIMDMRDEFSEAVQAIDAIDFTSTEETILNTFETTIRYLGGFLSAYDLSEGQYPALLSKAVELGEMLLASFDTPNRMPITRWDWKKARDGGAQEAHSNALVAEVGSLTLEFTRLSQITGDLRFYDAVQRVMDEFARQQMHTKLPGMWPITINVRDLDFGSDTAYTLGAMSDSLYEYLPKQHLLLGGLSSQYRTMYNQAADTFTRYNFYRPMTEDNADILFSALARADGQNEPVRDNSMQHLACFTGGMVGIGAKIFERPQDLEKARRLVDGCVWAYASMDNGLMTEVSHHVACPSDTFADCQWDQARWHEAVMASESDEDRKSSTPYAERLAHRIQTERLKPGYVAINDHRYILRPEAVESVFIWYRITGDATYQDKAWRMFEAIEKHTRTDIANAALDDVTASPPTKADRMESFWMAETLKYLYLVFADMDLISLDDFVFNTEAHPLLRPKR